MQISFRSILRKSKLATGCLFWPKISFSPAFILWNNFTREVLSYDRIRSRSNIRFLSNRKKTKKMVWSFNSRYNFLKILIYLGLYNLDIMDFVAMSLTVSLSNLVYAFIILCTYCGSSGLIKVFLREHSKNRELSGYLK